MIPYGRQSIDAADIEAVLKILQADYITQGPAVEEFEQALADVTGARHAVAFANGTAALHGACAAAGLGAGDLVATTPLTFVASANCARYVGAEVEFVDVDPQTLNLDPSRVGAHLDGLVAVHYAGLPVALDDLATRPRIVIEDAAHALGAHGPDGPVGNCARSDLTTFSFHPVKTITTGEGGAVTTNSDDLADRLRRFRTHGVERRPAEEGWVYDVVDLGYNYRLTDIQAALGSSQLRRLDEFVLRRNERATRYDELLSELPVQRPAAAGPGQRHGRHLYPIRVSNRRRVYERLREAGIGTQVHYVPVHLHSAFRALGHGRGDHPNAEAAYDQLLSLPLYPDLTEEQQDRVVSALEAAL